MKRRLLLIAAALPALAGAPSSSQTRDEGDLQTFTVLQVDPTASEIVVRETGTTRNRTLELDDRTALFGGALGGRATLEDLHPGDVIRAPGVAGSVSDRVRAERIQILAAPREPGDEAAGVGRAPGDGRDRRPGAMDPPPAVDPGALGRDPIDRPGALGAEPGIGPGALGTDPRQEPGRVGTDPGASDDETRGTGSPTPGGMRPGEGATRGGAVPGAGSGGSTGSGGSSGGSGGGGGGGGSGGR